DGVPGLALAVEQSERGTMKRPPFHPKESIFSRGMGGEILVFGLIMGLVSFFVGYWGFVNGRDVETWRTMVFTTLTIAQMGNALAIRSNQDSIFSIGFFSNMVMVWAILGTFVLQLLLLYVPFLQDIFNTTALSANDLIISLAASTVVFIAVEVWKWIKRTRETA
ncbi:MAG: cation transporting ATPase C-terminal domain-containing protein, partial [Anaerolineales bacterium]|nr:cation transporting ATPase C-terminal domain-containing protein [Anaerolineales bacterium]